MLTSANGSLGIVNDLTFFLLKVNLGKYAVDVWRHQEKERYLLQLKLWKVVIWTGKEEISWEKLV